MNLIVNAPFWLIALLILALAAAAAEDALRLKISNITCSVVLVGAVVAMAIHGLAPSLWQNAVVCLAILMVGTAAFAAGWLGGGDVKLLAAIGLWVDLKWAGGLIVAVFLAGGLLGMIYIGARIFASGGRKRNRREKSVPYGLAIVAGAVLVFAMQLNQRPADPLDRFRVVQRG